MIQFILNFSWGVGGGAGGLSIRASCEEVRATEPAP